MGEFVLLHMRTRVRGNKRSSGAVFWKLWFFCIIVPRTEDFHVSTFLFNSLQMSAKNWKNVARNAQMDTYILSMQAVHLFLTSG